MGFIMWSSPTQTSLELSHAVPLQDVVRFHPSRDRAHLQEKLREVRPNLLIGREEGCHFISMRWNQMVQVIVCNERLTGSFSPRTITTSPVRICGWYESYQG